ncbi:hypothetical protein FRC12_011077 [Ceratobasidium sp. 428]|nr:hypothetical protein FRC12_011077 [Ceratobasidium sp. 428]
MSDLVSESAETYSDLDGTVSTATEGTLPEAYDDPARRRLGEVERGLRRARAELDTKERAMAELKLRLGADAFLDRYGMVYSLSTDGLEGRTAFNAVCHDGCA